MKKIATLAAAVLAMTLTAAAQDSASLRDQVVGYYGGYAMGGDYTGEGLQWASTSFNYNEGEHYAVEAVAGEAADQIVLKNIFPEDNRFVDNGLVGTVIYDTTYSGYLGYIEFPVQEVGTFDGAPVTMKNMDYSWNVTEDSIYLWVAENGDLSMGAYFTLLYPYGDYNYYLYYIYASLNKLGDDDTIIVAPSDEDKAVRNFVLGSYSGYAMGGDYTGETLEWKSLSFNYNEGEHPAVVAEAGSASNKIVLKNIFPSDSRFEDNGLVGTVTSNTDYTGYLGWIEFPVQEVGTFDGATVTMKNMDYSWNISEDSIYLWVAENGDLSMGSYFTLFYPYGDYSYYLYYVYASLNKLEGGVNGIAADSSNGAVEYYNLNGIRVNGNNLPAGIYIMRQGNKAIKIAVK